jgi:dTMP kinase
MSSPSNPDAGGLLVAFEGLDQSGKQTQAERLRDALTARQRLVRLLSFPAYETSIGEEIARALRGQRDYPPEVMQLLYVANRFEHRALITEETERGGIVICDRYVASSVAYGAAQGLDAAWLEEIQRGLPTADLTVLLDIAPDVSVQRKTDDRDRYERDLALLARVRDRYRQLATQQGWLVLDASRSRDLVAAEVRAACERLLTSSRRAAGPRR